MTEVVALLNRERVDCREPDGWVLREPAAPTRGDELRARAAGTLAQARAASGQYVAALTPLRE